MTENEQESGLTPDDEAYFASEGEVADDVAAFDAPDEGDAQDAGDPPAADAKPADDASAEGDKGSRTVPHGALHAEREEHKKTKSELQDLRNRLMKVEWIQEQKAAGNTGEQEARKPEDEDPEPDHKLDVFEWIEWKKRQDARDAAASKEIEEQRRLEDEQYAREEQNARYIQGLGNFARQSVVSYAEKDPSISDAQKWLIDFKHKQFNAERFADPRNADPAFREYRMNVETLRAAEQAYQEGRDFGEVVMEYAKELGWQSNGQASDAVRQKVDRIGQAQQQSRTVAQAAGSGGGDELSIETIDGWDMPTFKRWYSEPKNARYYDRLLAQG